MRLSNNAKIQTANMVLQGTFGIIIALYRTDYKKREEKVLQEGREMPFILLSVSTLREPPFTFRLLCDVGIFNIYDISCRYFIYTIFSCK